ncbi:hypothetical protein HCL06_001715 [Salmonella enterica]|nr:hypothetical protein [Salmonella enterica]EGF4081905.1 hypothetical protein [Salmonella enterica]EKK4358203.1 hypothetical protein [Salmonella enterica subsp. enterica serovar Hartford]
MRYYDIKIFYPPQYPPDPNADTRKIYRHYTSLKNGVHNPGSLMVEFDILRFGESTPQGETTITIWGIIPQEMQQARQNMFGMPIEVSVGMSKGLPLANAGKSGLVLKGVIWQALGNWQGTELRLDLIVTVSPVSHVDPFPLAPINLTLPWNKGQKLSDALFDCFRTLGGYTFSISISDRLVNNYDNGMYCGSLSDLAVYLNTFSKSIIKDKNYAGVEIAVVDGNEIRVYDNDFDAHRAKKPEESAAYRRDHPTQLQFTDLIGQPTWIKYNTVSVPCVMRGDIQVGDYILMPKESRPIIQAASYSQFRDESAFKGLFQVTLVRLLGNSRQPDANSWVTVLEANPYSETQKQ